VGSNQVPTPYGQRPPRTFRKGSFYPQQPCHHRPEPRSSRSLSRAHPTRSRRRQVWSGALAGGDQVVVLLNVADEDLDISVGLDEIFIFDGPGGSAPQVKQAWHVYDLWADRMDDKLAQQVLDADTETARKLLNRANWYNSTAIPYKDGLKAGDDRLFGRKVDTIKARGTLTKRVRKHAAEVYRLKAVGEGGKRREQQHMTEL
jgi:alpha-galactosidase